MTDIGSYWNNRSYTDLVDIFDNTDKSDMCYVDNTDSTDKSAYDHDNDRFGDNSDEDGIVDERPTLDMLPESDKRLMRYYSDLSDPYRFSDKSSRVDESDEWVKSFFSALIVEITINRDEMPEWEKELLSDIGNDTDFWDNFDNNAFRDETDGM